MTISTLVTALFTLSMARACSNGKANHQYEFAAYAHALQPTPFALRVAAEIVSVARKAANANHPGFSGYQHSSFADPDILLCCIGKQARGPYVLNRESGPFTVDLSFGKSSRSYAATRK